jgi:hypothetical protein
MGSDEDDESPPRDKLIRDYGTVIRESGLLTTFAGILFGFLLNISVNSPEDFGFINRITLLVALFSITIAVSLFILPVIYHHLEYPYRDLEKFKERSHRFTIFGLIPAGITLYLGLEIALSSMLSTFAFIVATVPFIMVYIFFRMRK